MPPQNQFLIHTVFLVPRNNYMQNGTMQNIMKKMKIQTSISSRTVCQCKNLSFSSIKLENEMVDCCCYLKQVLFHAEEFSIKFDL